MTLFDGIQAMSEVNKFPVRRQPICGEYKVSDMTSLVGYAVWEFLPPYCLASVASYNSREITLLDVLPAVT